MIKKIITNNINDETKRRIYYFDFYLENYIRHRQG